MYTSEQVRKKCQQRCQMPVSRPAHRSRSTNQSCVQRSQNSHNFEKMC